jgi:CSLREA domain-containing protein
MPTEEQNSIGRSHRGVSQGVLALALMPPLKILATTVGVALLVWGLLFAYLSSPAWAATITVNSLADDADGADGECTLREAITSANTDTASGTATGECAAGSATENDVINFALPGTAPWTVNLTAELPPLASNIEIDGPGDDQLTVTRPDTAENFRIFTVSGDTTVVTISGMTISNGNVVDNTDGGGILIADSGTLTVTDSTISGNFTEDAGAGIAIDEDTDGTLTVTGSTITDNTAEFDNGGGISNAGTGTVTVTDSTISGNFTGHEGGALANDGDGTLMVTGSTIGPDNFSDSEGGGIYNGVGSILTVTGSTITDNSTNSDGGGIDNSGTLTVTDSTISGNTSGPSSFGGEGGGIRSGTGFFDPDETTTIINSTISGNTAAGEGAVGGGVYNSFGLTVIEFSTITNNTVEDAEGTVQNDQGSGVASDGDENTTTEVLSTIISENQGTDVDFFTNFGTPTNSFVSNGYNLIGDGNATGAFNQTGDTTGVSDPKLGDLADNGGPTMTHALLTGSPAIDKGPPSTSCPPPSTDQRGVTRPQDGNADSTPVCDIGSFELEPPDTTAPKVISTFPRNGGEVGPAANITATFSEDMQEASVKNAFKLLKKGSTTKIAAAVTYDAATDIATLNPTNNLKRGATYKAVVTTVAKDVAGNRLDQDDSRAGLQQKVWFFEID